MAICEIREIGMSLQLLREQFWSDMIFLCAIIKSVQHEIGFLRALNDADSLEIVIIMNNQH